MKLKRYSDKKGVICRFAVTTKKVGFGGGLTYKVIRLIFILPLDSDHMRYSSSADISYFAVRFKRKIR